jgi:hypothetical protein
MIRDPLFRAWSFLILLSFAGAGLAFAPDHQALALAVLGLSLFKARLILHHYLGLAAAPRWRQGFDLATAALCFGLAILALLAG